jgi:lambda family phage portal protein
MLGFLARLFNPPVQRSLEAAGSGRRWSNDPSFGSLAADLQLSGATIRRRARYYARNNPHAARISQIFTSNVVGSGIRPQSEAADLTLRAVIDAQFDSWTRVADSARRCDFYGLQSLIVRSLVENGEAFVLLRTLPPNGVVPPLSLQVLDPEQIDPQLNRDFGNGSRIISGIELDEADRPVAYHILPVSPGEPLARPMDPVRVDAADVCHVYVPLEPSQVRGLSWLAPAMTRLRDLNAYESAQIERQRVSALFAGYVTDPDGTVAS